MFNYVLTDNHIFIFVLAHNCGLYQRVTASKGFLMIRRAILDTSNTGHNSTLVTIF